MPPLSSDPRLIHEARTCDTAGRRGDVWEGRDAIASRLLWHRRDEGVMGHLRHLVASTGAFGVGRLTDEQVVAEVAAGLASGRLCACVRRQGVAVGPVRAGPSASTSADHPPPSEPGGDGARPTSGRPPPEPDVTTWVEFEVVGEDGERLGGIRYELRLPDGSVRSGRTRRDGPIHVARVDPGRCTVAFPDLDAEAVAPA